MVDCGLAKEAADLNLLPCCLSCDDDILGSISADLDSSLPCDDGIIDYDVS